MFFIEVDLRGSNTPSTGFFLWNERAVAVFFTIEYLLRWYKDKKHPGIIDLFGFLPFWIGFFIPIEHLKWVRVLRLVRLLKFHRYNSALHHFSAAIHKVKDELSMLGYISLLIVVFGSIIIYEIEKDAKDTKMLSLFDSVWWCVVTLTTIGYGDTYPITQFGRLVAMAIMILGVGIFGSFVSLMGSALVQVYRENHFHFKPK
jgi:voltage-gated potassium channel